MPLTVTEIKVELLRKKRTLAEIARELNVSKSHVSQVVRRKRRSPTVERAVAEAIGKPVGKVFDGSAAV